MIQNESQFVITLQRLGSLLEGLEDLHRTLLPKNATLYEIASESVLEDIPRLRQELVDYSAHMKVAG